MNVKKQVNFISWRFYFILSVIALAAIGLVWRVFDLAILDQSFLRQQSDDRALRLVSTPGFRGMIMDRNGFPLAVSTTVYSVWVNPLEFSPSPKEWQKLINLFNKKGYPLKASAVLAQLRKDQLKKREFAYLKRGIAPEVAHAMKALNIQGLYLQQDSRRYYPEGEATAHVLGFTNIDDQGQEGLELGYNEWLMGEPGKKWVIKDRLGRIISDVDEVQAQKPGRDLMLSIDRRIQYLAYRALMNGVKNNEASSGTAIVLDVKTGEILAMLNYPSFNPNQRVSSFRTYFRNRAITDMFEPGSTIKAFTIASALESGRYRPDAMIDTSPGWMRLGKEIVRDQHNNGVLSLTEILKVSSNMGVAKLVLSLKPNHLWDLLRRLGFGDTTGIHFPGEQSGVLVKHEPWGAFTLATLSFGYGMSATTLQIAKAYAVLANHGIKLPVSLLRVDEPPPGEQVIAPHIARQVLTLLESVVKKGGTAEVVHVPGYRIAGKTGTTKKVKVGESGYQKHRYNVSFVGMAPLSNPRLVVAVFIDDPRGKQYYAGYVAGPVFAEIMEASLRMLNVPPDEVQPG